MDLIYTIVAIVVSYYLFYKVIKPTFIDTPNKTKIDRSNDNAEYVDYEEVE